MFGSNRAKAEIAALDVQLLTARRKLADNGAKLDRAISAEPIQNMVRRALARVEEANRRAPPSQ